MTGCNFRAASAMSGTVKLMANVLFQLLLQRIQLLHRGMLLPQGWRQRQRFSVIMVESDVIISL